MGCAAWTFDLPQRSLPRCIPPASGRSPTCAQIGQCQCAAAKHTGVRQQTAVINARMRTLPHILRAGLLTLIMLAMATLPFAHRAGAGPQSAEYATFLAMGGTPEDICGDRGGHTVASGCEACRIVGATLLPPPVSILRPALAARAMPFAAVAHSAPAPNSRQGPPPARAPPFV